MKNDEIKFIELEEVELNKLNLMVAALYCRYRKREESWLSGFWARLVIGLAILLILLTLLEFILYVFEQAALKAYFVEYSYFIFLFLWAVCVFFVYKITIPNKLLYKIELTEEDYVRGNVSALIFLFISLSVFFAVLYNTESV